MKSLLIVAHGSRREKSNKEVRRLAKKVDAMLGNNVDLVRVAFLEFVEPNISTAVEDCFNLGVSELIVLPYFLSEGNHVSNDLPRAIRLLKNKWSNQSITVLPHIGAVDKMATLLVSSYLEGKV